LNRLNKCKAAKNQIKKVKKCLETYERNTKKIQNEFGALSDEITHFLEESNGIQQDILGSINENRVKKVKVSSIDIIIIILTILVYSIPIILLITIISKETDQINLLQSGQPINNKIQDTIKKCSKTNMFFLTIFTFITGVQVLAFGYMWRYADKDDVHQIFVNRSINTYSNIVSFIFLFIVFILNAVQISRF
jgi:hypothetical protein